MRYYHLLLVCITLIGFSACDKDKEGSLTLRFLAQADTHPVQMFQTENSINVNPLQFTHLSLFATDIKLLKSGEDEYLKDVELVDLSFDDLNSALEGFTVQIDGIPEGTYDGISFGIGVPADENSKVPADFPSSSPLSFTSYYWIPWNSYIFMKIEGRMDTNSSGDFETNFALHTGSNDLFRILESQFPLTITEGEDKELNVVFDYGILLEGIDIAGNPQNHNPEDSIQILQIVNNLQNAITLYQ